MNILITLAGKSLRFISEGYKKDKFLLEIGSKKIVLEEVVEMYNSDDTFHFIISKKQSKVVKKQSKMSKNKITELH